MVEQWDEPQAALQRRAERVREQLGIDAALHRFGSVTLVGSVAMNVMVARDIDLTVSVAALDSQALRAVGALAADLITRPEVREVTVRNDTGTWNIDAGYPDGIYLHVALTDEDAEVWTVDIWFVDEPERQPDLDHLRTIGPRITPETQAAILAIKRATNGKRPDGSRLPSYEIYEAVLDHGIRTPSQFRSNILGPL
jgi:hypothetical protein